MNLSGDDVEDALFAVNVLISELQRQGKRVPPRILELGRRFSTKWLIMSACGHETDCDAGQLEAESLIGLKQAADLLALSTRQVRRLTHDLDGEKLGRDWVFRLSKVMDYANARENR